MTKEQPVIVVLAAGQGSRYKGARAKLAEPLDGNTVLGTTLRNAVASHLPVLLVTVAELVSQGARWLAPRDILVLTPEQARRGMGHTIAAGVSERASAAGWLVLPADMPLVLPSTMRSVADALERHPVVFAQHHGRRGHPVGFGAELYAELAALSGDEGARRVVARYPVYGQEVDDPGALIDVDTLEDLERVRAQVVNAEQRASS